MFVIVGVLGYLFGLDECWDGVWLEIDEEIKCRFVCEICVWCFDVVVCLGSKV